MNAPMMHHPPRPRPETLTRACTPKAPPSRTGSLRVKQDALCDLLLARLRQGPCFVAELMCEVGKITPIKYKHDIHRRLDPLTRPTDQGGPPLLVRMGLSGLGLMYALTQDQERAQAMMAERVEAMVAQVSVSSAKLTCVDLTRFVMQGPKTLQEIVTHFDVDRTTLPAYVERTPLLRMLRGSDRPAVVYIEGQEAQAHALREQAHKARNRGVGETWRGKMMDRWSDVWGVLVRGAHTLKQLQAHGITEHTVRRFVQEGRVARKGNTYRLAFMPPTPQGNRLDLLPSIAQPSIPQPVKPAVTPQAATTPSPQATTQPSWTLDAARFPTLAAMLEQTRPQDASKGLRDGPKRLRVVEPVAPKLTPTPTPAPTAPTGKTTQPQTGPRKVNRPITLPDPYGPAQREAALRAAREVHLRGEAPDGYAVRAALGRNAYRQAFPKPPTEAQCRAMLEALAQEGALVGHGVDSDRFYSFPTPRARRP